MTWMIVLAILIGARMIARAIERVGVAATVAAQPPLDSPREGA